jgi:colanic acid/amylovoran biosynthesis glycosyltransferase
VHPDVEKFQLMARTRYMGFHTHLPANRLHQILKATWHVLTNFHKAPLQIAKCLNASAYDCHTLDLYLRVVYGGILFATGKNEYDIVHCHLGGSGLMGVALRKLGILKGKIVTTFHSADAYVYPHRWGPEFEVYKTLWPNTDLCTVSSDYMSQKIQSLGANAATIRKLPVGLDFTKFIFKERKMGSDGMIQIATVARLAEKKGLGYSIRAIAQVCKASKLPIVYKIAGEGPERPQLEQLIRELGMEKQIQLLGWCAQPEVTQLLAASHLFVLPSVTAKDGNKEGQALVIQEAQAVGLPLVTTIHNGIPEGLLDKISGFLVPERDVEAMADRIQFLVSHPEVWIPMGKAGRAFVEQNYDINRLNDKLLQYYGELIQK